MKRFVVAASLAALVAGCGGGGGGQETQPTRPSEGFQGKKEKGKKHRKVGDQRITATAVFDVGSGMTVHIEGGGARPSDYRSGSNCTKDETVDTFKTTSESEEHSFGFVARTGGSCDVETSWSFFKVSVKDPSGKEVGRGESLYMKGAEGIVPYRAQCDSGGYRWVGLTCSTVERLKVRIST